MDIDTDELKTYAPIIPYVKKFYKDKIHIVSTQNDGNDTGRKLKSFMIYK